MKTIITPVKLTPEEREVLINISADENGNSGAENRYYYPKIC